MGVYNGQPIAMFLVTSPIVINVPNRGLLAVETMHAIVEWLENLNIKRNITSMFANKKHRYRLAIVNVHTDGKRIFYPTCEMNTLNWMQSIVMGFVHWTCMPKCHTHRTQIFSPTCERKTINWMQSFVLWFANWTWMPKCCTSNRR